MALGLVVLYFLARLTAKTFNAYVAMSLAGATKNVRQYLGISLLPHGGVAVGLIQGHVGDRTDRFGQISRRAHEVLNNP